MGWVKPALLGSGWTRYPWVGHILPSLIRADQEETKLKLNANEALGEQALPKKTKESCNDE